METITTAVLGTVAGGLGTRICIIEGEDRIRCFDIIFLIR